MPKVITIDVQAVLIAIALTNIVAFGVGWRSGRTPKEVLCASYMEDATRLQRMNDQLVLEKAKAVEEASLSCRQREEKSCGERVETMRANIRELRCKICKQEGSR